MTPYFASVRFTRLGAPEYYPALISFPAKDFRDAGNSLFGFIAGFELGHSCRIAVEEISVNKPRGMAVSFTFGGTIEDEGLIKLLQDKRGNVCGTG